MPDHRKLLLVNQSTIPTRTIPMHDIARAVDKQLEHFAAAWGSATWTLTDDLHRQGFRIILRDYSNDPEAVANHWRIGGKPYATVYARDVLRSQDGSWLHGWNSVSATVSHEVLELLADPVACYYVDGQDDWMYALEIADPVQDDYYDIDGIAVSNFTYPDYWNPWARKRRGHPLDHMGNLTRPFEVRPGGYLVRYKGRRRGYVNGPKFTRARRQAKEAKPNGRTRRRLEQMTKLSGIPIVLPDLGEARTRR
jgi:hypothetical protein